MLFVSLFFYFSQKILKKKSSLWRMNRNEQNYFGKYFISFYLVLEISFCDLFNHFCLSFDLYIYPSFVFRSNNLFHFYCVIYIFYCSIIVLQVIYCIHKQNHVKVISISLYFVFDLQTKPKQSSFLFRCYG